MKSKIRKILFVIPSLEAGGAERMTFLLAKHFPKDKFDVTVVDITNRERFFKFEAEDKVTVHKLNKNKVGDGFWELRRLIKQEKPDTIISMITHLNTMMGLMKLMTRNFPQLILRETNVLSNLYAGKIGLKRRVRKHLNILAYKNSDYIICQSHFMADEVQAEFGIASEKSRVFHNPVVKPTLKNEAQSFDLIALGNLSPIKGYERLLEIISHLNNKEITLGIIGEGAKRGMIERYIKEHDLTNITLLGHQKNPSDYLVNAKILVMTSKFESFPNAVLEAGILGLPTIAYKVKGGMSEIIVDGKNGYLVVENDKESFVEKIKILLSTPLDSTEIINYTSNKFSMEKVIQSYTKLMQ